MTERGERVGIELLEGLIVLSALGGAVGLVVGGSALAAAAHLWLRAPRPVA